MVEIDSCKRYCTGCNSPPHSHNFFYILLFTFINFFLIFFNQWLRLKVAFYNYQSQPLIALALRYCTRSKSIAFCWILICTDRMGPNYINDMLIAGTSKVPLTLNVLGTISFNHILFTKIFPFSVPLRAFFLTKHARTYPIPCFCILTFSLVTQKRTFFVAEPF